MKFRDVCLLVILAAIWGGAFLFMRVAVGAVGPLSLTLIRVGVAMAVLTPLLVARGELAEALSRARPLLVVGVFNSALPFTLLAFATLQLTAGFTALINATTPAMTALLGAVWYGQRLKRTQWIGLVLGMAGVALLCWDRLSFKAGGSGWSVISALGATLSYGIGSNYSRRHLAGASPVLVSAGSMVGATLAALPLGLMHWPQVNPGVTVWLAALSLGALCTGVAYLMFYHLLKVAGATQATSVTFLVPVFAMLWSGLALGEPVTGRRLLASVVILAGTALTNRLISFGAR